MGLNPKLSEYTQQVKLATYDIDANNTLRPSALLRYCQEACELHLACYGLTHEKMMKDGIVFVFTRAGATIHRWPGQHDPITIVTRARGMVGVQFYRSFDFYCGQEHLAEVLQASVVVSTEEHKLLRPKAFLNYGVGAGENTGQKLERMNLPENMPVVGQREIRFSDLDYNGHVNNSVYNDIFCDFIPGGIKGRQLKEFQVHYVLESRENEVLEIQREERDGLIFLRGTNPRGISFEYQGKLTEKKTK